MDAVISQVGTAAGDVPTVSFSTLARVMGPSTPAELVNLLRGHKQRALGPRLSYRRALKQGIDFLVDGRPFDADEPLRAHEREAVGALIGCPPRLPLSTIAVRPTERRMWDVGGVRVTVNPDILIHSRVDHGAAKFVFTKKPLPRGVGTLMASLLWYYLDRVARVDSARPGYCLVYEPRWARTYLSRERRDRLAARLPAATAVIRALWPLL